MSESAFGGPPPPLAAARMLLRPAAIEDVPALVEVQEIAAVAGLAHIFPQDEYPLPREAIKGDWVAEIGRPGVDVFVVSRRHGRIEGFAALRTDESATDFRDQPGRVPALSAPHALRDPLARRRFAAAMRISVAGALI